MEYTPNTAIDDLEKYLKKYGFQLSEKARFLFIEFEKRGYQSDRDLYPYIVMPVFLKHLHRLRSLMLRKGGDPDDAIEIFEHEQKTLTNEDPYAHELGTYSCSKWRGGYRQQLADITMSVTRRNERTEILPLDILEGYLESHDETFPPTENSGWTDEALKVPYNTLSHIHGRYISALWVKFDDIREELELQLPSAVRKAPIDAAPGHLKPFVMSFLADHPDFRRNCFLIMPFHETEFHKSVHAILKEYLASQNINLHRADDKAYSSDLFSNIEAYIYGCKFAISIHDRVLNEQHNPNVSLEVGYMLGQKKEVCLLKERTVQQLPSDLHGKLYVEFDGFNIQSSVEDSLSKWLSDRNMLQAHS